MTSTINEHRALHLDNYSVDDEEFNDYHDNSIINAYLRESGWDPVSEHSRLMEATNDHTYENTAAEFANRDSLAHLSEEQRTTRWQVHHQVFDQADHPDRESAAEQIAEEVFHPLRSRLERIAYDEFKNPEALPQSDLAISIVAKEQSNFAVAIADGEEFAPTSMEDAYQAATDAIAVSEQPVTRSNINWEEFAADHNVDSEHYEYLANNFSNNAFANIDAHIQGMESIDPTTTRTLRAYSYHLQVDMKTLIINDLEAGSVEAVSPGADYGQLHLERVLNSDATFANIHPDNDLQFHTGHQIASITAAEALLEQWDAAEQKQHFTFNDSHTNDYWLTRHNDIADAIYTLKQHEHLHNIEHIRSTMFQTINDAFDDASRIIMTNQ